MIDGLNIFWSHEQPNPKTTQVDSALLECPLEVELHSFDFDRLKSQLEN